MEPVTFVFETLVVDLEAALSFDAKRGDFGIVGTNFCVIEGLLTLPLITDDTDEDEEFVT